MAKKYVFMFDGHKNPNSEEAVFLLGNKGAQLAEMTKAGLRVPYGFTVSTEACNEFYASGKKWPQGLEKQVKGALKKLEKKMRKKFGGRKNPLFVSVRSGSYVSMPGMMDTVLNLGMNDETVEAFANATKNPRVAYDSYRRFINMFGDVVMGVPHAKFEEALTSVKEKAGAKFDTDLTADDLKEVVEKYKAVVKKAKGSSFPQEPLKQLEMGISAVFNSWNTPRAVSYRRINGLRNDAGTGVNVQAMVFGNMGNDSGTGVAFTRNPATGQKEHYGEFLINAQGEDVVAGIRTPQAVDELKKTHPKVFKELSKIFEKLEKHYRELQDFEFTFEKGTLYLLQTRSGKRTAQAAVKIAVDMVNEKLISKEEAILRVKPEQLDQLLHKQLDPKAKEKAELLAKGLAASPGAAVGKIVFTAERATELFDLGEKVILVRTETSPEDIEGMHVAQGILTARGGKTSHAAVVARGMGKCCVAGCDEIHIDEAAKAMHVPEKNIALKELDIIALDGGTGEVFRGEIPLVNPEVSGSFATLMKWADSYRKLGVRTNADTPKDSKIARDFGAEGIGLCRTEHMFFDATRIMAMREMILANDAEGRKAALEKIFPMQKNDFIGLFKEMHNLPVTIRLLDPPLHEFLPKDQKEIELLAKDMGIPLVRLQNKIEMLKETNPMLGHRGCRLAVTFPEIAQMQTRAIIEAACEVTKKKIKVIPEIMVPLVAHEGELLFNKKIIQETADEVMKRLKVNVKYTIGTMIEVPRAVIIADKLAKDAEFFSFGTNDLTQMGYGLSRDDAEKFIPDYFARGILKDDPFQVLDQEGIGTLIKMAVEKGRSVNPKLEVGICGEHGGEPASVKFCHRAGLDYVSCSPYRIPVAQLAGAHAALEDTQNKKGSSGKNKKKSKK